MSRRWVVDASPLILLAKAGRLDLLSVSVDELLIPEAVAEEIRQGPPEDPAREWLELEGETFVKPGGPVAPEVAAWDLGRGESRVLSFGLRNEGWRALVDDGTARRCGDGLGIPVIGTLGVLVLAKKEGHLEKVRPITDSLLQAGLHVSEAVVHRVLLMVGEA